jgi:DNA-binding transcriptional LysR family regulator
VPWIFNDNGEELELVPHGGYGASGDVLAGTTLARHDAGLFQTYRFVVEDDLRAGRLVEVLKEKGGRSRPFILLYPHARHLSSRVRALVDFLVEKLAVR